MRILQIHIKYWHNIIISTSEKFKTSTRKINGITFWHGSFTLIWGGWQTSASFEDDCNQTIFESASKISQMEKTEWNSVNKMGRINWRKLSINGLTG